MWNCTSPVRCDFLMHLVQVIKDWIPLAIIGIVVAVDTILLLIGTAIPETRLNTTLVVDVENPTSLNVSFTRLALCNAHFCVCLCVYTSPTPTSTW